MPVMKFALGRMDEFLFNASRLTMSAIVLGLIVRWQNARVIDYSVDAKPRGKQYLNILLFALMTGFAYQVLFLVGIDRTSAGNTALIMSAIPIWTALLALVLLHERISRGAWGGLLIAVAGTLLVTFANPPANGQSGSLVGNLLVSASAFCWALASVISRPMMKNISPIALAFWSVALSVPLHFVVARHALPQIRDVVADPWLVAAIIYSGTFSTGLAYAMWNFGIKELGAAHAAGFQNLVPVVALIASWLLIGEVPLPVQLVGGALIIGGLIVMRRRRDA